MKKITLLFVASILLFSACQPRNYNPNLSSQEVAAARAEITALELILEQTEEGKAPNHIEVISLAQAHEKLNDFPSAIRIYEQFLKDGWRSQAVVHNLGRLYEKFERYDDAVVKYQSLVDDYADPGYLYDITWAHIRNKNRKEAEKAFNAWQLKFQKTDTDVQSAIKQLRDEEKNVE